MGQSKHRIRLVELWITCRNGAVWLWGTTVRFFFRFGKRHSLQFRYGKRHSCTYFRFSRCRTVQDNALSSQEQIQIFVLVPGKDSSGGSPRVIHNFFDEKTFKQKSELMIKIRSCNSFRRNHVSWSSLNYSKAKFYEQSVQRLISRNWGKWRHSVSNPEGKHSN